MAGNDIHRKIIINCDYIYTMLLKMQACQQIISFINTSQFQFQSGHKNYLHGLPSLTGKMSMVKVNM